MRAMMAQLKLAVNETKTRECHVAEETFDFLGYRFGRIYDRRTGCRRRRRSAGSAGRSAI
jgi:RNA-directed DNA polymerase